MATTEVWEVYWRMEVMDQVGPWELTPYDVLVWKCDEKNKITATPAKPQKGFVAGSLRVKLNGVNTTVDAFDVKLKSLGLTRADVMKAIA